MINDKRYKIKITRQVECASVKKPNSTAPAEPSTLGRLEVIDTENKDKVLYTCYTCENGGPSTDASGKDKRITSRDYSLEWTDSARNGSVARKYPKFKRGERNLAVWVTCDEVLPYFRNRRILIHAGNYPQDTLGCILLGKSKNTQAGWVSNSVEAVREFFEILEKIGIENTYLRVMEI